MKHKEFIRRKAIKHPLRMFVHTLDRLNVVNIDLEDETKNTAIHLWRDLIKYWRVH